MPDDRPFPPLFGLLPDDPFDRALLERVHPPGWSNPVPARLYDLVVVGAGTAGLVSAAAAAGLGARVALVEKGLMGGDCLNLGCVPSKTLIRSARAAAEAHEAAAFGVRVDGSAVDFAAVMQRVRRVRSESAGPDSAKRFSRELGVDVFLGEGLFAGPDRVRVGEAVLRFRKAIIATGARAFHPSVPGLGEAGFLTNETVFSLSALPPRLAVMGSGPLGCELAQAFARLGSRVTILERGTQLLPREERDAAQVVERSFRRDGIEIAFSCGIVRAEKTGAGKRLLLDCGGSTRWLAVDEVLVGAGRVPAVEGLGLAAAGVEFDPRKGLRVDDHLRTTNRRIFAAGDACLAHRFTHTADASARIAVRNALFLGRQRLSALAVPWCTFTDPELAHVGHTPESARQAGFLVTSVTVPMAEVDRARIDGEAEGFARIHAQEGSGQILGATIVCRGAGEMISEVSVAIRAGLTLGALSTVIHPYPTRAEAIRKAADAFNRRRLTPARRRTLARVFAFLRRG